MAGDGSVVVVGGTRAMGLEIVRHYAGAGRDVVLTGQTPENVDAPWPRWAARPVASPSTSRSPTRSQARWRMSGRSAPGAGRHRSRPQQHCRLQHRAGDPARDAQARRVHDGRQRPSRAASTDDASLVLFGGMAKERPYPGSTTVTTVNGGVVGLTRTLVEELKPVRVNSIHPGVVGDSPYWAEKPAAIASTPRRRRSAPLPHGRDRRRGGVPVREHGRQRGGTDRRRRLAHPVAALARLPRPGGHRRCPHCDSRSW